MSLTLNMIGGGGQGKGPVKKSTIVANYPIGSTCTVTNGTKTYNALDTSGAASFVVEPGEWTVTAVNDETASENVNVVAGGWVAVELSFDVLVVVGGVLKKAVSQSLTPAYTSQQPFRSGMANVEVNTNNSSLVITESNQDLKTSWIVSDGIYELDSYSVITLNSYFTAYGSTENYTCLAVLSEDLSSVLSYAQVKRQGSAAASEQVQTLDVSALSGNGKLAIAVSTQAATGTCVITEWAMTK